MPHHPRDAPACLVRMAELHDGATIFTLDHHFRIYRRNRRQNLPLIIPPPRRSDPGDRGARVRTFRLSLKRNHRVFEDF